MRKLFLTLSIAVFALLCQHCTKDHVQPIPEPTAFQSAPFASNLKAPIGIEADDKGNIWVTEAGTGSNNKDASVSMITPSGQKTVFVTGLLSETNQGSIEGISKLLYRDGKLYFLHGISGLLYIADVSGFKSGDAPVSLASIPSYDLKTFVESKRLTDPVNSNGFELAFGPDNNLYIVDAGGNAIIKRDQTNGNLSVFATFPKTEAGDEAVPTGIVYDGSKFLVSTLTGFPFIPGAAKIFQVTTSGVVSMYKGKFTTLAGIALSANNKPIVVQHGAFGMGFTAGTGKVVDENGNTLFDNLSQPTDIIRIGEKTYYVLSYKDGTISKLSY
ncbi:ScyD/ScyE family protein [Dyadobacter luteus]|uniref:ScyD/ScyE family protein n=1 Tax=Dyadobacter luteus TaxID=2259619 RepID=A0A3D8Y4Y6_9BACT|nr:ScyD/ScyE family protein [Dyadobacter luteus]REA57420.1 ScyD/ScyE family protein [Dyadobacter luteus]